MNKNPNIFKIIRWDDRPIVTYQKLSIIKVDLFIQNYPKKSIFRNIYLDFF